jgi:cytochrome c oxidase subunit 1
MRNSYNDAKKQIDPGDAKLSLVHIYIGYAAVLLGSVLQGLVRGGLIELPAGINYYQILTAHGVLLALVFTTYFIYGFLFAGMSRTAGTFSEDNRQVGWIGFGLMTVGTVLATIMMS